MSSLCNASDNGTLSHETAKTRVWVGLHMGDNSCTETAEQEVCVGSGCRENPCGQHLSGVRVVLLFRSGTVL